MAELQEENETKNVIGWEHRSAKRMMWLEKNDDDNDAEDATSKKTSVLKIDLDTLLKDLRMDDSSNFALVSWNKNRLTKLFCSRNKSNNKRTSNAGIPWRFLRTGKISKIYNKRILAKCLQQLYPQYLVKSRNNEMKFKNINRRSWPTMIRGKYFVELADQQNHVQIHFKNLTLSFTFLQTWYRLALIRKDGHTHWAILNPVVCWSPTSI